MFVLFTCSNNVYFRSGEDKYPVLDPPAPMGKLLQLKDKNNATCLVLAETDMYTFSPSIRRWTPQPRGNCVHHGLMMKIRVPSTSTVSFVVSITGRRLVCSNSHVKVSMRQTRSAQCETAGLYRNCRLSGPAGTADDGLTSCVAKCTCNGEDCQHVTIHIPKLQEQWEICEIGIE